MPSEDDLLPTEHWLWDNEKGAAVKSVKRYPVTIPASIRVGAFQRSCQAAILLGYAANWEVASAEQEEPPSVYSFIQLESAARNLIEALITRSETWGENLNTYALCARCVARKPDDRAATDIDQSLLPVILFLHVLREQTRYSVPGSRDGYGNEKGRRWYQLHHWSRHRRLERHFQRLQQQRRGPGALRAGVAVRTIPCNATSLSLRGFAGRRG